MWVCVTVRGCMCVNVCDYEGSVKQQKLIIILSEFSPINYLRFPYLSMKEQLLQKPVILTVLCSLCCQTVLTSTS